jgi:Dolichyl-phosphate-mannose-protein mannosyltransferase
MVLTSNTQYLINGMKNTLFIWYKRFNQPVESNSKVWRYGLALIIAVFTLTAFIQSLLTPTFEGSDEQRHYAYARYLVNYHTLPPRTRTVGKFYTYGVEQESGQPPLYYAAIAFVTSFVPNADDVEQYAVYNPFNSPSDFAGLPYDNHVIFLHGSEENFPYQGVTLAVRLGRMVSIIAGVLTLLAVFGLGRAIFPSRLGIALLAVALTASVPGFIAIYSVITNDSVVILFVTLSLWVGAIVIRKGPTPLFALFGGLFSGLAVLSKLNGVWVIGIVWIALIASVFIHRRARLFSTLVPVLLISGGVWLAVTGWWFAYGLIQWGDPFGIAIHAFSNHDPLTLRLQSASLDAILSDWDRTTWYSIGSNLINGPAWVFATYRYLYLIGIAGLVFYSLLNILSPHNRDNNRRIVLVQGICLILAIGLTILGGAYWQLVYDYRLGRLLYPGLTSAAVLAAVGWSYILSLTWRLRLPKAIIWAFGLCLAIVLLQRIVWTTTNTLMSFMPDPISPVPQGITRTQLTYLDPADNRTPVAEVIGYRLVEEDLHASNALYADICWRSVGYTKLSFPYSMQLVGPEDIRPGTRNSYHGLGRYPMSAWRPGEEFCDPTSLFVAFSEDRPRAYKLIVTLFDMESPDYKPGPALTALDGNEQKTYPVIGRVRVAPDPSKVPVVTPTIHLGDIAGLAGTQIQLRSDHTLSVTVVLVALSSTSINAHIYLHVLDSSGTHLIAQDDHEPDAGWFPTNYWQKGDVIDDHFEFKIPADSDIGQLNLRLGMYDVQTQTRLPAVIVATNERLRDDEVPVNP